VKDTFYFSHDRNARHDPKLIVLRSKYGYQGYGWYWAIVETLREQEDYKLNLKDKFTLSSLAIDLQETSDTISKFIKDCIKEFKLFASDGKNIWSDSLMLRMEKMNEIREKRREAGKRGGFAKHLAENSQQMPEDSVANANEKGSKVWQGKEKKVKENKKKGKGFPLVLET